MLLGPREGERASAERHHDDRLARGGNCFEQMLLRGWEIDRGAVAAEKAVDLDGHLLALKLRGKADKRNDQISLLCGGNGLVELHRCRCFPLESEGTTCAVAGVAVAEFEGVWLGVGQIKLNAGRRASAHDRRRGRGRARGKGGVTHIHLSRNGEVSRGEFLAVEHKTVALLR